MPYSRRSRAKSLAWAVSAKGASAPAPEAFRVFDLDINPAKAELIENDYAIGNEYPDFPKVGGRFDEFSFKTDFRGATAADGVPPEAPLLRACGMKETASGSTPNIVYAYEVGTCHLTTETPAGDVEPLTALHFNLDRRNRVSANLVGNCIFDFTAGQLPFIEFNLRGAPSGATLTTDQDTEAAPSYALSTNAVSPVVCGFGAITVHSVSGLNVRSVRFDAGRRIVPRPGLGGTFGHNLPGLVVDEPIIEIDVEDTLLSEVNFKNLFHSRSSISFSYPHNTGGAARQIAVVTGTGVLAEMPEFNDSDGIIRTTLKLRQLATTGKFKIQWAVA